MLFAAHIFYYIKIVILKKSVKHILNHEHKNCIGDITGGGTGIPTSNDLPNGWRFRYSSSIVRLADGSDFEDGLLPTISVSTDSLSQSLSGKDAIIERAIIEIQ